MSNETKKTALPKLRFPEFQQAPEWEDTRLGNVCNITNGKSNAQDHLEGGKYPLFDRSAVIKASNDYLFDCEAVIIPGEGMRFVPKYYVGKFDLHQRAYALKDFSCEGLFVYYTMIFRSQLLAKNAVQSTVLSLRLPILQNFPIQVPSPSEQQKIAATLSSLDALITAQSTKLDALQAHKRGLMQGLFPVEGEMVPKLRFPEFQESEEWVEKKFSSLCSNIASGKDKSSPTGAYDLFGSTGIIGRTDTDSHNGDFILVARVGANAGFLNRANGQFGVTDNTLVISLNDSENIDFVYCTLRKYGLNKLMFGSGQPLITGGQLKNLVMYWPGLDEQRKIADCLSSLDDRITAQSQKIEALKLHKKGLIQGLFPAINHND